MSQVAILAKAVADHIAAGQRVDGARRDIYERPMHYVYILKCADDSYYVGMTINLERRLKEHQKGYRDSSYTSTRRPVVLVWSGEMPTRADAVKTEHRIKTWTRAKKEALIRGDSKGVYGVVKRKGKAREGSKKGTSTV